MQIKYVHPIMQQRDAKPVPRNVPSSSPQLPVGPALDAQAFTLRGLLYIKVLK